MKDIHPKVEEALDTLSLNRVARRRLLSGAGLVSASAAAAALLGACSSDPGGGGPAASGAARAAGAGDFPSTPRWKFVFVCHVTTNPFFTPTQYGAQDACALLGTEFQWTGSKDSIVAEMVNASNASGCGRRSNSSQVVCVALSNHSSPPRRPVPEAGSRPGPLR